MPINAFETGPPLGFWPQPGRGPVDQPNVTRLRRGGAKGA
jgi:hypothetical protein